MSNLKNKLTKIANYDNENAANELRSIAENVRKAFNAIDVARNDLEASIDGKQVMGSELNAEEILTKFNDMTSYLDELDDKLRDLANKQVY